MTTALEIITRAMRKVGALTLNEEPTSDEANDALDTLNDLVESLANDTLLIPSRVTESFSLTGASEYTIGAGQDFDTSPPQDIISAYVRQGQIDYPLTELNDRQYADISYKGLTGIPEYYNYDNGYPMGRIKLWTNPSSAYTLYLLMEKPLTEFTLSGTVNLRPGWGRMLVYNLAAELSPDYGVPVSAEIYEIARRSRRMVRRQINKSRPLDWAPMPKRTNNIYSGYQ